MDILDSARRHGVADLDMRHAIRHVIGFAETDDGAVLYIGPDRTGRLLEVGFDADHAVIFHAMPCRKKFLP